MVGCCFSEKEKEQVQQLSHILRRLVREAEKAPDEQSGIKSRVLKANLNKEKGQTSFGAKMIANLER